MRLVLALGVLALATIRVTAAAAQSPPLYYCDAWHAYYPGVLSCPVPWRVINPAPAQPVPYNAHSSAAATPRPSFPILGDGLDDWCARVSLPSSIAICSDRELRALVPERQRAYDEARSRLDPDQQKALLADQNGWVKSYPRACGLSPDTAPSLPLAPAIQKCMVQAGRARIAYLRDYGASRATTSASTTAPAANATGDNGSVYRCRDPKTNFDYERPQPCAQGDITLAAPAPSATTTTEVGPAVTEAATGQATATPPPGEKSSATVSPAPAVEAVAAGDVAVLALTCTPTSVGPEIEGEIKNTSSQSLSYVRILATFRDANGRFVSVSDVYATFNPILPGQTSPFDGYGGNNPAITEVTVTPSILLGPALRASGILPIRVKQGRLVSS